MTTKYIVEKLKELKPYYEKEGLILVGLFGSYAHHNADESSDIDILYDINADIFCSYYPGFQSFSRLEKVKEELKAIFNKDIDLATIDNNSTTFKNYALKDAIYV
jgi:predicted nucleotidyltransferase